MSSALNRPGLVWQNPLDAQAALIKQLKKDHDMVIALSHMGYYPNEAPGIKFPGDEAQFRRKIPGPHGSGSLRYFTQDYSL